MPDPDPVRWLLVLDSGEAVRGRGYAGNVAELARSSVAGLFIVGRVHVWTRGPIDLGATGAVQKGVGLVARWWSLAGRRLLLAPTGELGIVGSVEELAEAKALVERVGRRARRIA